MKKQTKTNKGNKGEAEQKMPRRECLTNLVVNHKKECGKGRSQRKHKWLNGHDYEYEFAYCSECGHMQYAGWDSHREARNNIEDFHKEYRYCPSCGAKMEGGEYIE